MATICLENNIYESAGPHITLLKDWHTRWVVWNILLGTLRQQYDFYKGCVEDTEFKQTKIRSIGEKVSKLSVCTAVIRQTLETNNNVYILAKGLSIGIRPRSRLWLWLYQMDPYTITVLIKVDFFDKEAFSYS